MDRPYPSPALGVEREHMADGEDGVAFGKFIYTLFRRILLSSDTV